MSTVKEQALELHKKHKGKIEIRSKVPVATRQDLALAYTPGVAEPCREIAKDKSKAYDYTIKSHTIAVISDGSAVLGLGNIGPHAGLPVMEGKALLFKELAGLDAFPLCLDTQDPKELIKTIRYLAPTFGGINLEDIKAPECFEVENGLQDLGLPVMHDDQHATAIVTLAGLINAAKVLGKKKETLKIVINGAGAAGSGVARLLHLDGIKDIVLCDSKGIVHKGRTDLDHSKKSLLEITNKHNISGGLKDAVKGSDVFIGLSVKDALSQDMVKTMNSKPIIMAMANPDPEILPDAAHAAGAGIVATGRSDFPNQVNNVLAFPGVFLGALEAKATRITQEMKLAAAHALANMVTKPTTDYILPLALDKSVPRVVADAVKKAMK